VRLMEVHRSTMLDLANRNFIGATALMEWMVQVRGLSLRTAKGVVEKAVKYSERENQREVSYPSLQRALRETKIHIAVNEQEVTEKQRPEVIFNQEALVGNASTKGISENLAILRRNIRKHRAELTRIRGKIEDAKTSILRMERQLGRR